MESGCYQIDVSGNLVIVEVVGTISRQGYIEFYGELKEKTISLTHESWASLLILEKWELDSLDTEDISQDIFDWTKARNFNCQATVVGSNNYELKLFRLEQVYKPDKISFEHQFFVRRTDAIEWLSYKGFNVF